MTPARGFSLIDMFLTMAVMAVLVAIVLPRYEDKSEQARQASALAQLSVIRKQIEVYDAAHPGMPFQPLARPHRGDVGGGLGGFGFRGPKNLGADSAGPGGRPNQWQQLTDAQYLSTRPANPLQGNSTEIVGAPIDGAGWVFADPTGAGSSIYAIDAHGNYLDADGDGVPD